MAVAVMFPGLLLQHPATPVQKAANTEANATMNKATVALPMCKRAMASSENPRVASLESGMK